MPVKESKRQRIFDAIAEPISRARVIVRTCNSENKPVPDVDKMLRELTQEIWTRVKIEAGLRD